MAGITQGGSDHYVPLPPFIRVPGEILRGAREIAEFLFGDSKYARQVYYLVAAGRLPVFRMGGICARKATLIAFIEEQEHRALEMADSVAAYGEAA